MTAALKPCCPCCGSDEIGATSKGPSFVICEDCYCEWNESKRRTQPPQQSPVQPVAGRRIRKYESPAELIAKVRSVLYEEEAIATVIDNNQSHWKCVIETAPNVTLPIGTKLYTSPPPREQAAGEPTAIRDGSEQIATVPAGTRLAAWDGKLVVTHPDYEAVAIQPKHAAPPPREQAAPLPADIMWVVEEAEREAHMHCSRHPFSAQALAEIIDRLIANLRTALAGYENEVLERAARVCDDERVDAASTGEATDESYNIATEHCAAAIRAMKKEG